VIAAKNPHTVHITGTIVIVHLRSYFQLQKPPESLAMHGPIQLRSHLADHHTSKWALLWKFIFAQPAPAFPAVSATFPR
jgi:hypothetical protein